MTTRSLLPFLVMNTGSPSSWQRLDIWSAWFLRSEMGRMFGIIPPLSLLIPYYIINMILCKGPALARNPVDRFEDVAVMARVFLGDVVLGVKDYRMSPP